VKDYLHHTDDPVDLMISQSSRDSVSRKVEDGVGILNFEESTRLNIHKSVILFIFSDNSFTLQTSISENAVSSGNDSYIMAAYPFSDWDLRLEGSDLKVVIFTIARLHELFGNLNLSDPGDLKDALKNYRSKSFYTRRAFSPKVRLMIHDVFKPNMAGVAGTLMIKAKLMELLSVYMQPDLQAAPADDCPYISDNLDWQKIREAEKILISDLQNPPTIKELARLVGTNELKLKTGFKHLFGNTIYGYLTDYRMDFARLGFEKDRYQVKDMAAQVGYANPSHFIAAFRKRFGVTPKKYLQSLND
jgi:AraC-like DNA-binding protein